MKKILLPIFMLISFFVKGQIVNIPDSNFLKKLIQDSVDVNHDGQIQVTEAAARNTLTLSVSFNSIDAIHDITGINAFINLKTLNYHDGSYMNTLDLTGLHLLENFDYSPDIFFYWMASAPITSINLAGLLHLTNVNIAGGGYPCLLGSQSQKGNISSLNISGCINLNNLRCSGNSITNLDLTHCLNLNSLYCGNNFLKKLNLLYCPNLTELSCEDNQIDSLDISRCPNLPSLGFYNDSLVYLNVKNGNPTDLTFFGCSGTFYFRLINICADSGEVNSLAAFFNSLFYSIPTNINPYCNFTPGGHFNTLQGSVKLDLGNNGCDSSDYSMPYSKINISHINNAGINNILTDDHGKYIWYLATGDYIVKPILPNNFFISSPDSAIIHFSILNDSVQTANFCIIPAGIHPDLEINILPHNRLRPGFMSSFILVYKNKGNQTLSGKIQFRYDANKLNFVDATPGVFSQTQGLLEWNYTNLTPLQSGSIFIRLTSTAPPVNNIGDSLVCYASISPLQDDETPSNNADTLKQFFSNSYDPNDKTCLQGTVIDYSKKDEYVDYVIRFQNTGNDTAFNVVVKDLLTDNYDWNSFEITKTSHPCVINQTNGNKIEFIFAGINLPPKITHDSASNGFVAFKIKSKSTIIVNDSLNNKASIYFDFNLPVITNTATTLYKQRPLPVKLDYFKGRTYAGKNILDWKANCTGAFTTFSIEHSRDGRTFNTLDNFTVSETRCLQKFDFTDYSPFVGINYYRIKMTDENNFMNYTKTIALLNQTSGFEIIGLTPVPVVANFAVLSITSSQQQWIKIDVLDVSGKLIQSIKTNIPKGFSETNINFENLASGIYSIVIVTTNGERKILRFSK